MDFDRYQYEAEQTMLPSANNLEYLVAGLAGEAGEVASAYAKFVRDNTRYSDLRNELVKEIGDVLWFVSSLATLLDVDLRTVAEANVEKLQSRAKRNKLKGSGNDR